MSKQEELYKKYIRPSLVQARDRKNPITYEEFHISAEDKLLGVNKTYFIYTFGCQGNVADSEIFEGILNAASFTLSNDPSLADIIILNTCAIRESAEDRVWGELGRLKKYKLSNPNLLLVLAGCMSQEEATITKVLKTYPHVDIILGTHNINKILDYIKNAYFNKERVVEVFSSSNSVISSLPKTRPSSFKAYINIMYGCDEFCTYCIVPYTRGKERSLLKESILEEINALIKQGCLEIVLLGQNVNAYGKDCYSNYSFGNLLEDIALTNIPRIRFTTSHPHDLDLLTIQIMSKYPNIMPHFHLPVQSGSSNILLKMNRHYTKEDYISKVKLLKQYIPTISITTDIIVGFSYETESDFEDTLSLVKEVEFEGAYTFMYSKREGTPAARFDNQVDASVSKERLLRLNELTNELTLKANKKYDGKIVEVLVEGKASKGNNILYGYSKNYKLVNFEGDESLIGKLVNVKINKIRTWFLLGELSNG
ncbi:MAG: tRNA (N6-isopentenyl adenosine(37)-C2)-methylthiotransferase MiaB [Acholeplasmatales bacterium]|jgi:tRNA-2-methylthio-N6-dimethylallyladenosine synthase|nr:tRNA (N6-isopentenyl adenosine(37)-C2)-methylthiotransferase MiaB [Acholeplasmatales bacterium]